MEYGKGTSKAAYRRLIESETFYFSALLSLLKDYLSLDDMQ